MQPLKADIAVFFRPQTHSHMAHDPRVRDEQNLAIVMTMGTSFQKLSARHKAIAAQSQSPGEVTFVQYHGNSPVVDGTQLTTDMADALEYFEKCKAAVVLLGPQGKLPEPNPRVYVFTKNLKEAKLAHVDPRAMEAVPKHGLIVLSSRIGQSGNQANLPLRLLSH